MKLMVTINKINITSCITDGDQESILCSPKELSDHLGKLASVSFNTGVIAYNKGRNQQH